MLRISKLFLPSVVDYFNDWNCALKMVRIILSTFFLLLAELGGQDQQSVDFDIDNRGALAQVLRDCIKGKWQLHSNKTFPFDEFKQKSGLQHLLYEEEPFTGWYGQWDDNGTLRNLRRFSNGKADGPILSWRKNGDKLFQGKYREGKKQGTFSYWSQSLRRIKEENFNQGKLDGICTAWYENGNKSSIQTFISGKILNAKGWKPNGDRCPSTKVVNGIGVLVFYDETNTQSDEGLSKMEFIIERYENGNKREEGSYLDGKKEGLWIYYKTDGTEFFRTSYDSGIELNRSQVQESRKERNPETPQSLSNMEFVVERYENGNKRGEGYYFNGKKEGLWIYYRTDETEFFRTSYESGEDLNRSQLPNEKPFIEVKVSKDESPIDKKFIVERYQNGNKREEGSYLNGKKEGLWIYYATDGTEFFRKIYESGKELSTNPSTNEQTSDEIKTRKPKGSSQEEFIIERYENGNKREEGSYLNGIKEGLWIYYRTDGTEFFRTTHESNKDRNPSPSKTDASKE
ncbi:MAG: hypothetical protein CMI29_02970 [Opitutae bacterium]|nr:hypothetical protein [Opitutae bacterium]